MIFIIRFTLFLFIVQLSFIGAYRYYPSFTTSRRQLAPQQQHYTSNLGFSQSTAAFVPHKRQSSKTTTSSLQSVASTSSAPAVIETKPVVSNIISNISKVLKANWLVIGEIAVIFLAKYNPQLGATGGILKPELTVSKIGVFTIFFINGIAIAPFAQTSEAERAAGFKTNLLIQLFNFGMIPVITKILAPMYPDPMFRDGLLVLACLPCTINICVAQTVSAGANVGTAIFNAILANVIGVFMTPLLAIWMLGAGKGVSLLSTLNKLGSVVILPLICGQIARQTPIGGVAQRVSKYTRTLSSCLLLAIVYNVFSDTFVKGIGVKSSALASLALSMPAAYLIFNFMFWQLSKKLVPGLDASTRSAALLCSSQKTLAFGIPFIKTALGTRPDIAYILAPLLMYAPAQLLLGSSLLVPVLRKWMIKQQDVEDGGGI